MSPERSIVQWETVGTISIDRRISISDSSYFFDEPILVTVASGQYSVEVRYGSSNGTKYVSALRLARGKDLVRGSRLNRVLVDFGQIGVCDRDAAETAFQVLGDTGMSKYFDQLQTEELVKIVTLPGNVMMIIARPAVGDGLYPVYVLGSLEQVPAGVEIDLEHSD